MIQKYEEQLLHKIDSSTETASDDELFAGGYLRGHISLAAADCELLGIEDKCLMNDKVKISLVAAKSELSPGDWVLVQDYWLKLLDK